MKWFAQSHRLCHGRGKGPYLIWLSEIILQQTRVEHTFLTLSGFGNTTPRCSSWRSSRRRGDEALGSTGYYSRARNLHAAARYITRELGIRFPDTYEGIRQPEGVRYLHRSSHCFLCLWVALCGSRWKRVSGPLPFFRHRNSGRHHHRQEHLFQPCSGIAGHPAARQLQPGDNGLRRDSPYAQSPYFCAVGFAEPCSAPP